MSHNSIYSRLRDKNLSIQHKRFLQYEQDEVARKRTQAVFKKCLKQKQLEVQERSKDVVVIPKGPIHVLPNNRKYISIFHGVENYLKEAYVKNKIDVPIIESRQTQMRKKANGYGSRLTKRTEDRSHSVDFLPDESSSSLYHHNKKETPEKKDAWKVHERIKTNLESTTKSVHSVKRGRSLFEQEYFKQSVKGNDSAYQSVSKSFFSKINNSEANFNAEISFDSIDRNSVTGLTVDDGYLNQPKLYASMSKQNSREYAINPVRSRMNTAEPDVQRAHKTVDFFTKHPYEGRVEPLTKQSSILISRNRKNASPFSEHRGKKSIDQDISITVYDQEHSPKKQVGFTDSQDELCDLSFFTKIDKDVAIPKTKGHSNLLQMSLNDKDIKSMPKLEMKKERTSKCPPPEVEQLRPPKYLLDRVTKSKFEHNFFSEGLDSIIQGYKEQDFQDKFLDFFEELDFAKLTHDQKQLIFSQAFEMNSLGKMFADFMRDFLDKQAQRDKLQKRKEVNRINKDMCDLDQWEALRKLQEPLSKKEGKDPRKLEANLAEQAFALVFEKRNFHVPQYVKEKSLIVQRPKHKKQISKSTKAMYDVVRRQKQNDQKVVQMPDTLVTEAMTKPLIPTRKLRENIKANISSGSSDNYSSSSEDSKVGQIEREIMQMQKKERILELERILRSQGKEVNRRNLKELQINQKKREELQIKIRNMFKQLMHEKSKQLVVEAYNQEVDKIRQKLANLDEQVNKLTAGDLRVLKARKNRLKYNSEKDISLVLSKGLALRKKEDTGWPTDSDTHRKLMKKCFDKTNMPIARLIHTTQKIKYRRKANEVKLEQKLDELEHSRNCQLLNKVKQVMNDNYSPNLLNSGRTNEVKKPLKLRRQNLKKGIIF